MSDDENDKDGAVSEATVAPAGATDRTAGPPDPVTEPGSGDEPEVRAPSSAAAAAGTAPSRLPAVAIALVAAAVVLAVVVGWFAYGYLRDEAVEQARVDARAAAEAEAVAMFEYDHASVDQQAEAAARGLTPDFAEEYMNLMNNVVAPGAKEKSITVQVGVQGSAVVSADADRAEVLLYLNQITTSSENPEAASSGSRVLVELVKDGDRWLVDRLSPI